MSFEKLTELLKSLEGKYGVPGLDCIVMKDHKVIYRHMQGCSDYEKHRPVDGRSGRSLFSG